MNYLRFYPAFRIWGKNSNKLEKEADVQAHASNSGIIKADLWVLELCGLYCEPCSQNKILEIWEAGVLLVVVSR